MTESIIKTCSDVMNKQSLANLSKGTYYCSLVEHIVPNGMVHYDTDATECVLNGLYKSSHINLDANGKNSNNSKCTDYD